MKQHIGSHNQHTSPDEKMGLQKHYKQRGSRADRTLKRLTNVKRRQHARQVIEEETLGE